MGNVVRVCTFNEVEELTRVIYRGFGNFVTSSYMDQRRALFIEDRSVGVFDGDQLVGGAHSHPVSMNVPGGKLPCAGVDNVAVQPTHRRKGFMTQMMEYQLRDIYERGEPLASLWATESVIYGRYGYGAAVFHENWKIERNHSNFAQSYSSSGALRFIELDEALANCPEVFGKALEGRPGGIDRPKLQWVRINDWFSEASKKSVARYTVAYEMDGWMEGYVRYEVKDGIVSVLELMPVTRQAYWALWDYCFGIDLVVTIESQDRPIDEPLPWMLADPRQLERRPTDALWIRLVDVPLALSCRTYNQEAQVVFEIEDNFCPWNEGRYKLVGGPQGSECQSTTSKADLSALAKTVAEGGGHKYAAGGKLCNNFAIFSKLFKPITQYA